LETRVPQSAMADEAYCTVGRFCCIGLGGRYEAFLGQKFLPEEAIVLQLALGRQEAKNSERRGKGDDRSRRHVRGGPQPYEAHCRNKPFLVFGQTRSLR
jgi:hypothetical protein